jgi:hypothetical protein
VISDGPDPISGICLVDGPEPIGASIDSDPDVVHGVVCRVGRTAVIVVWMVR